MKKIWTIVSAVLITGGIAVWKSVDTKVIKQSDEIITQVLKKSKQSDKAVVVVGISVKQLAEKSLRVKSSTHTYIKNGIKMKINTVNFKNHRVFRTKLSKELLIAPREIHYSNALQSLQKSFGKNKEKFIASLRKKNSAILKRDQDFIKANKKEIAEIENKMLLAVKNNNPIETTFWYNKLKKATENITFKLTEKGKPIKYLNEEEILQRQISDIVNPTLNRKSKVFGFTWHHSEKTGVMELVDEVVHTFNKHTGGFSKWGKL